MQVCENESPKSDRAEAAPVPTLMACVAQGATMPGLPRGRAWWPRAEEVGSQTRRMSWRRQDPAVPCAEMLHRGARRRIYVIYANHRNRLKLVGVVAAAALVVGACSGSATPSPSAAAASSAPASSAAASTAPAASSGGAAGTPLFVAIDKSADQQ